MVDEHPSDCWPSLIGNVRGDVKKVKVVFADMMSNDLTTMLSGL